MPKNHSISKLEELEYSELYNVDRFSRKEDQTPFCVTVIGRNNVQNNRYEKLVLTLLQQEYQNYHVVFVDDASTDGTLVRTKELMEKLGFPRERVAYVQNKERMFATYNIINAAFNFCKDEDVQMLVDGDDELIGRFAFQVINSKYQ